MIDDYLAQVTKMAEQNPATILIADDNALNIKLLESLVGLMGHNTLTADDGQEAIDKITNASL